MAYSWPSKEGAGSFLVLREEKKKNLPSEKKIQGARQAASAASCCPQRRREAVSPGIPNHLWQRRNLKLAGRFPGV